MGEKHGAEAEVITPPAFADIEKETGSEWNVADAEPWWEDMVDDMVEHCGRVNVA